MVTATDYEKRKEYFAEYRRKNKEKIAAYHQSIKPRRNETNREWRKTPKGRQYQFNRRQTAKYQEGIWRYNNSPKGKEGLWQRRQNPETQAKRIQQQRDYRARLKAKFGRTYKCRLSDAVT